MQPTDHQPPRGTGPNLMGNTGTAPTDRSRILARLEHGEPLPGPLARRRMGRIAASTALILVLVGALAWTLYQGADPTVLDVHSLPPGAALRLDSLGAAQTKAAAATLLPPPAPPDKLPANMPDDLAKAAPEEKTAAAIVNETPAAAVKTAAATSPASAPIAPTLATAAAVATVPITAPKPHPLKPAPPSAVAAAAKTAAAPARNKLPLVAADSDVTLLTALVAHANNQTVPAPPDAAYAANPASRDVVSTEPKQPSETTESLLRRCKQLGLIEGMLCHSRICTSRWDSEPACK